MLRFLVYYMSRFSKFAGGLATLLVLSSVNAMAELPKDLPDFNKLKPSKEAYIGKNGGFMYPDGSESKNGKILHQIYSTPEVEVAYVVLSLPCFNGSKTEIYKMAIRDHLKKRFFYRSTIFGELEEIPWNSKPRTDFRCPAIA